jgi:hypothetical protein
MGRTKGSLNKKTIEAMATAGQAVNSVPKTAQVNPAEDKVVVPINKSLMVEGFNPDDYKQYYEDGTPYLPFKVQLAWFRLRYPNGKTPVYRPEWSEEKIAGTYVASARVYRDASDPVDCYLAEAAAKRGPDTRIQEKEISIDPYTDVQRAALSLALRFAGFWCSLTEADVTKELAKETENEQEQPAEEAETATTEEQKTEETVSNEQATDTPAEETPVTEEVSEEKSEAETPKTEAPEVAETQQETPAVEETAEETTTEEAEQVTENDAEAETSDTAIETPVEESVEEPETEDVPANSTSSSVPDSTVDSTEEPVEETASEEVPQTTENAGEAEGASEDKESSPEKAEEQPPKITEEDLTDAEKEELSKLREMFLDYGYYKNTIGVLEKKFNEGSEFETNIFLWLLSGRMSMKNYPEYSAAVHRICELLYPELLKTDEKNGKKK